MRLLMSGATILELLIYAGLLSVVAVLSFGLVLQIRKNNQDILVTHTKLNAAQMALELLGRDIRMSKNLEIKRNARLNLACKSELGTIQWYIGEDGALFRKDHQTKLKKPTISKVAEDIKTVVINQPSAKKMDRKMDRLPKARLVHITINLNSNQTIFRKSVILRPTICL